MRKMKMSLLIIVLCIALASTIYGTEITSMESDFVMGEDGNITVTSQLLVLISEGETSVSIPIGQGQNAQILGQSPKVVTTEEGRFLTMEFTAGSHRSQEFTLTYQVENPIGANGDHLLLTLPILPEGCPYTVGTFSFTVTLPQAVESAPKYVGGYYSEIADNFFRLTQTPTVFSGKSLESLRDHDDLTFSLELPKDYILWNGDEGMAWWLCALLLAVLGALGFSFWNRTLRNPKGASRGSRLPAGVGPGDLGYILEKTPPSLPLELTHWATRGLICFYLDSRTVLRITQKGLVGTNSPEAKRKACQRMFEVYGECYHNDPVYGREASKYEMEMTKHWKREIMDRRGGNPGILGILTAVAWAVILAYSGGCGLGSFVWRPLAIWLLFALGLCLCLVSRRLWKTIRSGNRVLLAVKAGAIVLFFGLSALLGSLWATLWGLAYYGLWQWCSWHGGKRSKKGMEIYHRCRGFRHHIKSLDGKTVKAKMAEDPMYFYNVIGYAHAVGQGDKLVQKMGKTPLQPCPWLISNGKKARNAGEFYAQYKRVLGLLMMNH